MPETIASIHSGVPVRRGRRLAVLASGQGTLLEAMIASGLEIDAVFVDRPCRAELVGHEAGLAVEQVTRTSFEQDFDRVAYSLEVADRLTTRGIDLVAMAGWGTIFSPEFFDSFEGDVLNSHPALLPAFKGWNAVEGALAAGVKVTGCTIHFATAELDAGPILAQEPVRVLPADDAEVLHERIKSVERELYPRVIAQMMGR